MLENHFQTEEVAFPNQKVYKCDLENKSIRCKYTIYMHVCNAECAKAEVQETLFEHTGSDTDVGSP